MTVNEALRSAILPIIPICEPEDYDGEEKEYCTFLYDDQPDVFADGFPGVIIHRLILNWYLPHGHDPIEKKTQICRALCQAGFTYPYVTNSSDDLMQHYVFECDYPGGSG